MRYVRTLAPRAGPRRHSLVPSRSPSETPRTSSSKTCVKLALHSGYVSPLSCAPAPLTGPGIEQRMTHAYSHLNVLLMLYASQLVYQSTNVTYRNIKYVTLVLLVLLRLTVVPQYSRPFVFRQQNCQLGYVDLKLLLADVSHSDTFQTAGTSTDLRTLPFETPSWTMQMTVSVRDLTLPLKHCSSDDTYSAVSVQTEQHQHRRREHVVQRLARHLCGQPRPGASRSWSRS